MVIRLMWELGGGGSSDWIKVTYTAVGEPVAAWICAKATHGQRYAIQLVCVRERVSAQVSE